MKMLDRSKKLCSIAMAIFQSATRASDEQLSKILETSKKHDHIDFCFIGAKYKYWKTVYSMGQKYILLRGIFRTLSNMCDGALKIGDCVNCIEPLTIYTKCSSLDVWKVLDTLMLMQPEEETNAIVGTIKVIYKAEI